LPELSVIVPTYKERENVPELVKRLGDVLAGLSWEVVFVEDDSPDGTSDMVRALAQNDVHVRCLQRVGRRGLASASIEGMLATSSPYLAVMDGYLQHDESLLPRMLETLRRDPIDIVVGSRYVEGGGLGDWAASRPSSAARRAG
jgi:dolichol-phosphate mannosyltransferase